MAHVGVGDNVILQGGLEMRKYVKRRVNYQTLSVLNKLYHSFPWKHRIVLTYVNRTPIVLYF